VDLSVKKSLRLRRGSFRLNSLPPLPVNRKKNRAKTRLQRRFLRPRGKKRKSRTKGAGAEKRLKAWRRVSSDSGKDEREEI